MKNISKLIDAYCYLHLKSQHRFEEKVLKQLLDRAFLEFEEMTEEQIAAFEIHSYAALEELFEGHEYATEMIEELRENEAIAKYFGEC